MPDYTQTVGFQRDRARFFAALEKLTGAIEANTAAMNRMADIADAAPASAESDPLSDRHALAGDVYADYDFGRAVEGDDGWEISGDSWTRNVYLEGPRRGASDLVRFYVEFEPGSLDVVTHGVLETT